MFSMVMEAFLGESVTDIQGKIYIVIYSSLVYSCVLVILKQYLRSVSSSSLGRRILSASISSSERMGCPMSRGKLDG